MPAADATSAAQAGSPLATARGIDQMLTPDGRRHVLDTFIGLLDGLYTHLPLKRAMYGIDPVQQLRLLRRRADAIDDHTFHTELWAILTALRDAHTLYIGPRALAGQVARLPFLVETFGPDHNARYLVSKTAPHLIPDPAFMPGVELTRWNGVPIALAVDRHADRETGGRPDSRRARAVESLTFRALQYGPPPDEHWVTVGYTPPGQAREREVRLDWQLITPGASPHPAPPTEPAMAARAINPVGEQVRRAKKLMFNPRLWAQEPPSDQVQAGGPAATMTNHDAASRFDDNVTARTVATDAGRFGYLRLWSFDLVDDDGYLARVIDLLDGLPRDGLIIDLRANPGGLIWAAERLLQLFTPHPIEPTRFSLLATELTRAMASAAHNQHRLGGWAPSLDQAIATGELYSQALPITPVERANDIGQIYSGPVVAVVDANTYSAGDLFAAGFVDNQLGTLVSIGQATGAGGANVWDPSIVTSHLAGTPYVHTALPAGLSYRLSVRRATRIGAAHGTAIEDLGVRGDRHYVMTNDDLLHGNRDLLNYCGQLLAAEPRTALEITATAATLIVTTQGLNRLDIHIDGRPRHSLDIDDGTTDVAIAAPWSTLTILGYQAQLLRQRRHLPRPGGA